MEPSSIERVNQHPDVEAERIDESHMRLTLPGRMAELHPEAQALPIAVEIHLPSNVSESSIKEVVVSLHGQGADAAFDEDIAQAIRDSGRVVIAPTTSRLSEFNPEADDFLAWQKESFSDKKYPDELADFRAGIEAARNWLKQQPFPHAENVRLVLMGQSLGGTMAVSLAEHFKPSELILVSPASQGLDANPDEPLLGQGTPNSEQLAAEAKAVSKVVVIRGEQDAVTTPTDAEAFGGTLVSIPDAGHTFGKLSFMEGDENDKRSELIRAVLEALN